MCTSPAATSGIASSPAHPLQLRETLTIPPFAQQLDGEPDIAREELLQPGAFARIRLEPRQPQNEAARTATPARVDAIECVRAFRRVTPAARDEPAQLAVPLPIGRQRHEAQATLEPELRAYDEPDGLPLGGARSFTSTRRPHHAGDGHSSVMAIVPYCCSMARPARFLRMRGATKKRKVTEAMQLSVLKGLLRHERLRTRLFRERVSG